MTRTILLQMVVHSLIFFTRSFSTFSRIQRHFQFIFEPDRAVFVDIKTLADGLSNSILK